MARTWSTYPLSLDLVAEQEPYLNLLLLDFRDFLVPAFWAPFIAPVKRTQFPYRQHHEQNHLDIRPFIWGRTASRWPSTL